MKKRDMTSVKDLQSQLRDKGAYCTGTKQQLEKRLQKIRGWYDNSEEFSASLAMKILHTKGLVQLAKRYNQPIRSTKRAQANSLAKYSDTPKLKSPTRKGSKKKSPKKGGSKKKSPKKGGSKKKSPKRGRGKKKTTKKRQFSVSPATKTDLTAINQKLNSAGLPNFCVVLIKHNRKRKTAYGAYQDGDGYRTFSYTLGGKSIRSDIAKRKLSAVEVCKYITKKKKTHKIPKRTLSPESHNFKDKHCK
jgi:hypothetical protein